ncbi:polyprenol phosphomannose-dependent alpha 1,6 mannosyltransferase MptB [Corynebacterium simulans]|uniref:polyprenol phosphomannose-dependent alpha 1,6 mannosyltransferase MptB n=1 Tax=Corynebacterium simulans TaxID=146827 RepID=UPI00200470DA|nr:polyprenol phosphomannose-dependent alpha 1,6 mannosyltransferase MptB [Corynebacterium simulans]MCK6159733.1 polyprenol phosphomannose-dependent alpha 1,6 mannosyltransferase MptB [Corynebacterium simulans]
MKQRLTAFLTGIRQDLPRLGSAGSRSAQLHADGNSEDAAGSLPGALYDLLPDEDAARPRTTIAQLRAFFVLRWMGTLGAILIAVGGLGAGALPVVGNPYDNVPFGSLMSRMLQSASALVFCGVGLMVTAWVLMAPFVGTPLRNTESNGEHSRPRRLVTESQLWRTWAGWVIPLVFTAPLFTQDIYSYLANGSIVTQGLDPYSGGPVELLGSADPLARSVPFIWANSPSPYGPVALGLAGIVSVLTGNSIILGVIAHRLLSLAGIVAAGWAISQLAIRCRVSPESALWLGILNPLTTLHLVGGIHNESVMLGLALVGVELGLRGVDRLGGAPAWLYFLCSGLLISCAGMVKVTGFIGLGFIGMALARVLLIRRGYSTPRAIGSAVALQFFILMAAIALVTLTSGIGLGWITGQGGAASIRSWLSSSTAVGVSAGFLGMLLGLGDHTDAILTFTRTIGVIIAAGFMLRMLLATYRGSIHPVGGLGIATLVLVIFFPVVHPWYILWAVLPLAAWANRLIFRITVVIYSAAMSFFVLPRGLGLPPGTIVVIYTAAIITYLVVMGLWMVLLRRSRISVLN